MGNLTFNARSKICKSSDIYVVFNFSLKVYHSDRLLLLIIVMGLSLNDYKLNISVLAADIKLTIKELSSLATELGCIIERPKNLFASNIQKTDSSSIDSCTFAKLVVPLKFPENRRKKLAK